jgi:hypothetical protein
MATIEEILEADAAAWQEEVASKSPFTDGLIRRLDTVPNANSTTSGNSWWSPRMAISAFATVALVIGIAVGITVLSSSGSPSVVGGQISGSATPSAGPDCSQLVIRATVNGQNYPMRPGGLLAQAVAAIPVDVVASASGPCSHDVDVVLSRENPAGDGPNPIAAGRWTITEPGQYLLRFLRPACARPESSGDICSGPISEIGGLELAVHS